MAETKFMGLTVMRVQTAGSLRELREPTIVMSHNRPLAALVPYQWFLDAQAAILAYEQARAEVGGR